MHGDVRVRILIAVNNCLHVAMIYAESWLDENDKVYLDPRFCEICDEFGCELIYGNFLMGIKKRNNWFLKNDFLVELPIWVLITPGLDAFEEFSV